MAGHSKWATVKHFKGAVFRLFHGKGIKCAQAEVTWLPELNVLAGGANRRSTVSNLSELLEDHADVKEVHSNAELIDG